MAIPHGARESIARAATELAAVAPFSELAPVDRARLAAALEEVTYEAGDVIFSFNHLSDLGLRRGDLSNAVSPSAPVQSMSAPDNRTVVVKFVESV